MCNNVGFVVDQPAACTIESLDLDAIQTNYDCWTDENNDKSNNSGYVADEPADSADEPADYDVEPADIDLQSNSDVFMSKNVSAKYDSWTV
jgi:hypothetical protein